VNSAIVVTNARGVHGPVVAEHVMALVFALAKRLPSATRYQQKRVWGQELMWNESPRPREVAGATLGIVGLGSIGREVARLAVAAGMRVLAGRENPGKGSAPAQQVYGPAEIGEMLRQSDYVVLAAPLTRDTAALINRDRLALMKPDAYLINVARGPLVDVEALVEALRSKRIAGAALDVFAEEPLPPESPLWGLENVLITPHTAAVTERLWERHYELICENLRRFMHGEELLGIVDKDKAY